MILEVTGINVYYGVSHILFDVSLNVEDGEVVCLLGRNGVGKTTILRSISGLVHPRSGNIRFKGTDLRREPSYKRAKRGIGFVPDDRRIFPTLTVRENLDIGIKDGGEGAWTVDRAYEFFPELKKFDRCKGGNLSGGEQQMLAIARTLMGNPTLLLMDEPAEGLSPMVTEVLTEQVFKLKGMGQSMLICEQHLPFAIKVSDRAYLIERGRTQYQGSVKELQANEEIKRKYLMV